MSVVLTKIRTPKRRKDVLRRQRLIDSLHNNLHRKLTFVSAPAGYGKTTLLIDFAADVDAVVCWYLIGEQDGDLVPFLEHLVAAFQQHFPDFGSELLEIIRSAGSPSPEGLAVEFVNQIETHVDDFCILVLDDYHLIDANEKVIAFVESLLEFLPDQVRLLIGSRSVYGIPTANLYVREDLAIIGKEDLRFSPGELQALVRQNYGVALDREDARELAKRADGWVVALLLAVRSLQDGRLPKFEGAAQQVYTFLAQEVIGQLPEHLRDFMLAMAVVDEFNAQLSSTLYENGDIANLLQELVDRNLFITRIEGTDGINYRFHQLFLDFLRQQLSRTNQERKRKLHAAAAEWYRKNENWELAVQHKISAQDPVGAAEWMDLAANDYFIAGRQKTLAGWYQYLVSGDDLRELAPHLLMSQAKVLGDQSDYKGSEELLDIAERSFRERGDVDQVANVLITRGMLQRLQGFFAQAYELGQEAEDTLTKAGKDKAVGYRFYQAKRLKGLAKKRLNELEDAARYLSESVEGFRRLRSSGEEGIAYYSILDLSWTLNDLGLTYLALGKIFDAQNCFQEALQINKANRTNLGATSTARNNLALLYHETGDFEKAQKEYLQALDEARSAQWPQVVIAILNGLGDLHRDIEELDKSEEYYQDALKVGQSLKDDFGVLGSTYLGLAEIDRCRKEYNHAIKWVREAAANRRQNIQDPRYQLALGAIYLDMEQEDLALEALETSVNDWKERSSHGKPFAQANFHIARTHAKLGDPGLALDHLKQALETTARLGYDQFLLSAGRQDLPFMRAMANESSSPQLESLINRIENFKPGMVSSGALLAEDVPSEIHLEVKAFGLGEVYREGQIIPGTEWRSTRARALFFYIVEYSGARKEDIALQFWPDFDTPKISSNFHATLWRVRRALGEKDIILFEDGKYMLSPIAVLSYDVAEFSDLLRRSEDQGNTTAERIELLRRAIGIYRGDYLDDILMDWSDQRRRELQEKYLSALMALASLELDQSRFVEVKELSQKALSLDPYRDKAHYALMQALAKSGSPASAVAHYRKYQDKLHKELAVEPSDELKNLYLQLSSR